VLIVLLLLLAAAAALALALAAVVVLCAVDCARDHAPGPVVPWEIEIEVEDRGPRGGGGRW
jgi:hypothetical protein